MDRPVDRRPQVSFVACGLGVKTDRNGKWPASAGPVAVSVRLFAESAPRRRASGLVFSL